MNCHNPFFKIVLLFMFSQNTVNSNLKRKDDISSNTVRSVLSSETESHICIQIVVVVAAATTALNFHVPLCSVGNHGWYFILLSFNPFQVEYSKYTSEYYTHSEVNLKGIYFSMIYQPNPQIFKSIIYNYSTFP